MSAKDDDKQIPEFTFSRQTYPLIPPHQPLSLLQLSPDTSGRLLSRHFEFEPKYSGSDLLSRIKQLDRWTAEQLAPLDEALERFLFKVLVDDETTSTGTGSGGGSGDGTGSGTGQESAKPENPTRLINEKDRDKKAGEVNSFVALSYCWHYPSAWLPALGLQPPPPSSPSGKLPYCPMTPAMFAAFLSERLTPEEPIWLDQWCIDQTNEAEKIVAIGAMDALYYSARLVVVCLEDVRLSPGDAEIISKFAGNVEAKQKPDDENGWDEAEKGRLWTAVERIFAARWFVRAWCAHEYWMARNVVFLAPVTADPLAKPGEVKEVEILRFDNRFLQLMHSVASKWFSGENAETVRRRERLRRPESVEPGEEYYWGGKVPESREEEDPEGFVKRRAFGIANNQHRMSEAAEAKLMPQISSFAVIQSMAAGFERDKLSVWLNASRTRLFIKHNDFLSEAERAWIATIVSLASGDATVLAAVGPTLADSQVTNKKRREIGWACNPEVDDYVHLGSKPIYPALDGNPSLSPDGLALDAIIVDTSSGLQSPHSTSMKAAQGAISWYTDLRKELSTSTAHGNTKAEPGGWEDIDIINPLYTRHLTQALAILLELSDLPSFTWTRLCLSQAFPRPGSKYAKLLTHPLCAAYLEFGYRALSGARHHAEPLANDKNHPNEDLRLWAVKDYLNVLHSQDSDQYFKGVTVFLAIAEGIVRTVCGGAAYYRKGKVNKAYELQVSDAIPHGLIVFAPPPKQTSKYTIACPLALSQLP
ncbi:hypothetical protein B0T20DRAFT_419936 [Sordaria brevicollis]|uniref:Heterokaryon incompatibility domain-containing protein n=1 Tax=Sordaria brevicollis TaxID=83679 RepID=A0AAE0P9T8_SORBR|nr:hypothetical protein B0T20DRAFT_419936 [Sordaria brevicollis]